MVAQLLFFFLAIGAIVGALGMLLARNPVNSALWLISNLFCVAGLYLTMNAAFIAVIQVLVYAGAIMVLFLFVIMLLNLSALPSLDEFDWRKGAAFILGMGVLAQLTYIVAMSLGVLPEPIAVETAANAATATAIGIEIFTRYAILLQVIGVLLLAATIGAVMIAKRELL